jgi:hypothetical protein
LQLAIADWSLLCLCGCTEGQFKQASRAIARRAIAGEFRPAPQTYLYCRHIKIIRMGTIRYYPKTRDWLHALSPRETINAAGLKRGRPCPRSVYRASPFRLD